MSMLNLDKCYQILDVDSNSTPKEIKQAYRKLSLKYHPDRNTQLADGKKFKEISEAYQFLKANRKNDFKKQDRSAEQAHSDFWKYQGQKMGDDMRFNFESFTKNSHEFGGDLNDGKHNTEKPISQKSTHFILYGGVTMLAVWIIIFEIL